MRKLKKLTIGDYIIPAILVLFALAILIPIWYVVSVSLVPMHVYFGTRVFLYPPLDGITLENYRQVFSFDPIRTGFINTIFVTITSTVFVMFINVTFAYAMLKPIPGRRFIWVILMFTMFFSGGLLPFFLMMVNLGLVNNRLALVLPHGLSIFTVILMQSYIRTLSPEYEESARLDGAGDMRLLWSIVLPLCKPMLATLALFAAVSGWNRWFEGMLFMQRVDLQPLQLVLRNMLDDTQAAMANLPVLARRTAFGMGLQMAAVVVTMLPIICVFPFLQKYFVKGITLGGVKG